MLPAIKPSATAAPPDAAMSNSPSFPRAKKSNFKTCLMSTKASAKPFCWSLRRPGRLRKSLFSCSLLRAAGINRKARPVEWHHAIADNGAGSHLCRASGWAWELGSPLPLLTRCPGAWEEPHRAEVRGTSRGLGTHQPLIVRVKGQWGETGKERVSASADPGHALGLECMCLCVCMCKYTCLSACMSLCVSGISMCMFV